MLLDKVLLSLLACGPILSLAQNYVDLSYSMSSDTIFFPGQRDFQLSKDALGVNKNNIWYSAFSFCMGEHGGTHLDAPYHFYREGWTVDQIPAEHLIDVSGAVIDIEDQVSKAPVPADYLLTVEDVIAHERRRGPIRRKGLVLVHTGWSKYLPDKERYLGWDNSTGAEGTLSFPGVSEAAAKWLYNERQIVGLGIDTASIDTGKSKDAAAHVFLASKQVYNLENVASLHLLLSNPNSEQGLGQGPHPICKFFILPMKIVGGTGSPTRILAACTYFS